MLSIFLSLFFFCFIFGLFLLRRRLNVPFREMGRTKWTVFKESLRFIFLGHKNPDAEAIKDISENHAESLPENVYHMPDGITYKRIWFNAHMFLKYRVILPLLNLFDIFFDSKKIDEIPQKESNYLLLRFKAAFDNGMRDWFKFYFYGIESRAWSEEEITSRMKHHEPVQRLTSLFWWFMTILRMDNSYKEAMNCILLRLHEQLQDEFKDKRPAHLFYTSPDVNDIRYFSFFTDVKNSRTHLYEHDTDERK